MQILVLILLFVLVILGYTFYAYNRLTQLKNTANTEWAQIDVNLKKRADLIPNLVEIVKGYARHELSTLESLTKKRGEAVSDVKGRGERETELSAGVATLFALKEAYPDLKANQNFLALQKELFALEDDIAEHRSNYNDVVKAYNDFVLKFPGNLVASIIGFSLMNLFEFTGSRDAPVLNL